VPKLSPSDSDGSQFSRWPDTLCPNGPGFTAALPGPDEERRRRLARRPVRAGPLTTAYPAAALHGPASPRRAGATFVYPTAPFVNDTNQPVWQHFGPSFLAICLALLYRAEGRW